MSAEALDTGFAELRETGVFARAGVLRRLARERVAALAGVVLIVIVLAALLAPWISPYDPYFTDLTMVMRPPDAEHWFGTDNTGRDIFSRVLYGTRNTLMLGLIGVIVGGFIGGALGILAAYYRRLDGWIMRLVDVMLAFPAILIALEEPVLPEHLDLFEQDDGIDHHPLAQHAGDAAPQDARRDQVGDVLLAVDHQGVSGVGAAAPAHHHLRLLGQQIDDLPLPLVPPLRSNDDDDGHLFLFFFLVLPVGALARATAF